MAIPSTREQFKDHWLTKHSEIEKMIVQQTSVRKIVASFAIGEEARFDGMVEIYYDNIEDFRARKESADPFRPMLRKDEENFIDLSAERVTLVMEEYVIAEKTRRKAV